ncbi:energy transducer TonB [Thalassotalea fusca]
MNYQFSISSIALLICTVATGNANEISLSKHIETIVLPEPIERVAPKYPIKAARESREGWARYSFIIEKDGSVSNVVVNETSGSSDMTREGLRAIKRWKYEPAMKDGKPVQQCNNTVQMDFKMHGKGEKGVSRKFRSHYQRAMQAMQDNQLDIAKEHLSKIENLKYTNISEHNFYQLAALMLAEKQQDKHKELHHINQISLKGDYLDDEIKLSLLQRKFALELNASKLASAYKTYNALAKNPLAKSYLPEYEKILNGIEEQISQGNAISIKGDIQKSDFWSHTLVGNQFSLNDIEGHLTKLDIRCKNKRHLYTIEENNTWTLPNGWSNCRVLVFGEDNAKFTLVEKLAKT